MKNWEGNMQKKNLKTLQNNFKRSRFGWTGGEKYTHPKWKNQPPQNEGREERKNVG